MELFSNLKMEILILVLIFVGGWFLFKIIFPAVQMTREQSKEIGDASKYAKEYYGQRYEDTTRWDDVGDHNDWN